ncbi:hypothetical protein K461DRAFT_277105 [Myriangium duriaei CBS 260.36]|uniref:Uncharacterized protein n=1 Tax=Myriangium duriaei CBS 260.36 TaxID=1168546 RepID=A0A9P4J7U5_9PEZI|nr:hypothetical protein K461DRAFT_277105 [Myriangium duriaei CBS 260.36]
MHSSISSRPHLTSTPYSNLPTRQIVATTVMATVAPILSPVLTTLTVATGASPAAPLTTAVATKLSAAAPSTVKAAATKAGTGTYVFYRLVRNYTRNTRITPIATYLAYKSSGYADTGSIAGMTISDFVAVWTPYNIDPVVKRKAFAKGMPAVKGAGTKESTARIVLESEGREGR